VCTNGRLHDDVLAQLGAGGGGGDGVLSR